MAENTEFHHNRTLKLRLRQKKLKAEAVMSRAQANSYKAEAKISS